MLERHPLSRFGTAIERFATDNKMWKVLLALHYALKHFRKVDISFSLREETCRQLILARNKSEILLSSALLYQVVERTSATYQDIKDLFGHEIYEQVFSFSKEFEDERAFVDYFRPIISSDLKLSKEPVKLIEERYPLNRDGVFLERFSIDNGYWKTFLMLHYANKRMLTLKRDDGNDEINHSTEIACAVMDRGKYNDKRLSLAEGHDVPENAPVDADEIEKVNAVSLSAEEEARVKGTTNNPFNYKRMLYLIKDIRKVFGNLVADDIRRLTKFPGQPLLEYYQGILESEDASAVKAVDKENIVSTMIIIFAISRQKKQIKELEEDTIPFMKLARNKFPEVKGILFSCRRHIKYMIQSIKRYIQVVEFTFQIFGSLAIMDKQIRELKDALAQKKSGVNKAILIRADDLLARSEALKQKETEFMIMTFGK